MCVPKRDNFQVPSRMHNGWSCKEGRPRPSSARLFLKRCIRFYLCGPVFVVFIVLQPMGRVGRIDEPVDVYSVVVGHERRVVEDRRQKVDGRHGGQQQKDGLKDGTLVHGPAEMVAQSQR